MVKWLIGRLVNCAVERMLETPQVLNGEVAVAPAQANKRNPSLHLPGVEEQCGAVYPITARCWGMPSIGCGDSSNIRYLEALREVRERFHFDIR